jgi:hypothetical protein
MDITYRAHRIAKALNLPTPPAGYGLMGVLAVMCAGTDYQRILYMLLMATARSESPETFNVRVNTFKAVLGIIEKHRAQGWPDKEPLYYSDDLYVGFLTYLSELGPFTWVDPNECLFVVNNADLLAELHLTGFDAAAEIARRKLN